jgi:4-amino-4-deoxy-L-arabinose transferase-like glycosyltransferase
MRNLFILMTILLTACLLRFWQFGNVPISPDWDEVSLAYNAHSIATTGKDEYGKFLPIILRSFDDYKPALYAYLSIPTVSIFGLTAEAVRFPSAFFGILTVLATFFLVRELFKRNDLALLSAFLLAISPWHIQFSRIAFESNVGVAFNLFAVLFFIFGLKRPAFIFLSAFFAGLNIYVYQGEKVFTPILFLALAIIFRKDLLKIPVRYLGLGVALGVLIVLPMLGSLILDKNALGRARGVSIFAEPYPHIFAQRLVVDKEKGDFLGFIFDNRRVYFVKNVISGYISHFDLNWLFTKGDIARHHAPNMGLMYLFELPFLLIGIYLLVFGKFDKKIKALIILWILITPISASVTSGVPHAVRTLNFLPTPQILTALGLLGAWEFFRRKKYYSPILILFLGLFIFNFSYYLNQYFVQQNFLNAKEWQFGYEEMLKDFSDISKDYKRIVVSNQPPMDQSYMFFLFYLNYDPALYQEESKLASGGFREDHLFGKFEFRPIKWDQEKKADTLFIGRPNDFPENINAIKTVNYPNGQPAMKMVKQ